MCSRYLNIQGQDNKQTRNSIQHKHMGRYGGREIDPQQQPASQISQDQIFLRSNTGRNGRCISYHSGTKFVTTKVNRRETTLPDLWPVHAHSRRYMSQSRLHHLPCTSQLYSATSGTVCKSLVRATSNKNSVFLGKNNYVDAASYFCESQSLNN
jgi:hypothetical protein